MDTLKEKKDETTENLMAHEGMSYEQINELNEKIYQAIKQVEIDFWAIRLEDEL